jgi:hypothetical protein
MATFSDFCSCTAWAFSIVSATSKKLFINYRLPLETREIYNLPLTNDQKSSCKRSGTVNSCNNERLGNFESKHNEILERVVIF